MYKKLVDYILKDTIKREREREQWCYEENSNSYSCVSEQLGIKQS